MPILRNEAAAVEMTALAAGAGPPANKIATRSIGRAGKVGCNAVSVEDAMACSVPISIVLICPSFQRLAYDDGSAFMLDRGRGLPVDRAQIGGKRSRWNPSTH
jgi:hypothetical protein